MNNFIMILHPRFTRPHGKRQKYRGWIAPPARRQALMRGTSNLLELSINLKPFMNQSAISHVSTQFKASYFESPPN